MVEGFRSAPAFGARHKEPRPPQVDLTRGDCKLPGGAPVVVSAERMTIAGGSNRLYSVEK